LIERLLAISIRHRAIVVVLTCVFVVLGAIGATKVSIDAVPDVTNVQVQVITAAPALGPVDVETYVTVPVERAMAGLPGLRELRSISRPGISQVTLAFDDATDLWFARQIVSERLAQAKEEIPASYGVPQLGPPSSGLGEVLHFEVKGPQSLMERRAVLDWQIAPRLRLVPGVVDVGIFGGEARTLEVTLDPQKLANAKLGVADVVAAIKKNHVAVGGAYLVDGRENVTVRGEGRVKTAADLAAIAIELEQGEKRSTPLYVRDVADVRDAPLVRYGAVTRDGRPEEGVVGVVMMLRGANSRKVVADAKEAMAEIGKTLPPGMTIDLYYDRTALVERTIHTVESNLVEASVLVLVVLVLTLMSFRAGVVVAISIPLALLGVFLGMWLGGVPGNLVSLGAIDFGLVVDGAIIIVENAMRRLSEQRERLGRPLTDEERRSVVFEASKEVRGATAFGEAIIALVYVPILTLQSIEGRMFRPMALTVLFALAAAFVLSLTLVPALASWLLPCDAHEKESPIIRGLAKVYRPALVSALRHGRLVALVALGGLVASVALATTMGREFLPKLDEGTVVVPSVKLPSVSLAESTDLARQVEKTLLEFPEVTSVVSRTGRAEVAVDPMGMNMSDVYVLLKPRSEWKTAKTREELIDKFSAALDDGVPGVGLAFSQPIEMNTNDLLAGISSDLAVHVYGHDLVELKQTADKIARVLRTVPGAKDVHAEQIAGLNVLTIEVDRTAVARNGLDVDTVLETVSAIGGVEVGEVTSGPRRFPIQVRLGDAARKDPATIASLPVRTPQGNLVPLGQLAHIELAPGPSQVSRERLARRITVQANVRGRDIGSFAEDAQRTVDREVKLPTGYFLEWAGEYERLKDATKQLAVVIPIALAMIVVLLVLTFGRMRPALLIALNVPVAVSGGIVALAIRGLPLSVSAGIGFIALFGVAVLNGLVLVTTIERLRDGGASREVAAREAAEMRLRPVLTTALVASLGFVPMAIATGAGAEVQRPLATVVIGGIVSSTLLTLLVLPSLYAWLGGERKRARDKEITGPEPSSAPAE
jgi:cobalt-zinc-cadmium resistance protein CzcA